MVRTEELNLQSEINPQTIYGILAWMVVGVAAISLTIAAGLDLTQAQDKYRTWSYPDILCASNSFVCCQGRRLLSTLAKS